MLGSVKIKSYEIKIYLFYTATVKYINTKKPNSAFFIM